jgi:FixJ family two-component response regulator
MMDERAVVCVVDDDESVRDSLPDLLQEFGFDARTFSSAAEFLASELVDATSCLILDIAMPEMSGPELHQELLRLGNEIPVVFITAQGDEGVRQRLIAQGASECLFKPFSESALLDAIQGALHRR